MKRVFLGLLSSSLLFTAIEAKPISYSYPINKPSIANFANSVIKNLTIKVQQNIIGDVTAIETGSSKITVKTQTGTSFTISVNDQTKFRRVQPGQTSLANAEEITFSIIKIGDRILIPGGSVNAETPVKQVIVMAREAIAAQRDEERERRRARTFAGRITAANPQTKEIIIQSRGRDSAQPITVSASGNVKFLKYASDSLKLSDGVGSSFDDLHVGDQVRIIGDRSADGSRVTAEEIVSGSVTRSVGSIVEINIAQNQVSVKDGQTGQTLTVAIGKKTTLRRIPDDVAENLKKTISERAERRRNRPNQQSGDNSNAQTAQNQNNNRRNRRAARSENANGNGAQQGGNRGGVQSQFENLPTVTIAELKKGNAVLITGTSGADKTRMTAVSIVTGDADLQPILQRTQGGRNNASPNSPGLPGNISGGNSGGDPDEPRK